MEAAKEGKVHRDKARIHAHPKKSEVEKSPCLEKEKKASHLSEIPLRRLRLGPRKRYSAQDP